MTKTWSRSFNDVTLVKNRETDRHRHHYNRGTGQRSPCIAGPFMGKMFLIVVDSNLKWLEVEVMSTVTSESTIQKLREMFARYGVPQQIVNDNGPQFTSRVFSECMKKNGVKHTLVAPYHPRSNGQAERFVQTFKQYFKAERCKSINQRLPRFIFSYTGQLRTLS